MSCESGLIDELRERAQKAEAALATAKEAVGAITFPKHRGACNYWDTCVCGAHKQDAAINRARQAVGLEIKQ